MGSLPKLRQRFQSDLQHRLGLIAYVPILCLAVMATGALLFLPGSTAVRIYGIFGLLGVGLSALVAHRAIRTMLELLDGVAASAQGLVAAQEALLQGDEEPFGSWQQLEHLSNDELGVLSTAINSMYRNTIAIDRNRNESIKAGISNIVISLARRSQALLDRQVEYIDQLESTEEDPDRLEQMFKVDHLATRMRRNAESLLVLAEADPGRRRGGPVDIADVLRVAMGEIENYQHIHLTSVEPGRVTATAAVDLAHLSAELMENATQFSPPEAPVQVSGRMTDGRYLIEIVDHGMGMGDDQLAQANATLSDPPELGLAMGRSLGFVVVGRLARRLGAQAVVTRTAEGGTTARVGVPTSVFATTGASTEGRRTVVAPEPPKPEPEPTPTDEQQDPPNSKALNKLLGLETSPAEAIAQPRAATSPEERSETWTPPPVTPDAPVSLPPEVAALAGDAPPDGSRTQPAPAADSRSPLSPAAAVDPIAPTAFEQQNNLWQTVADESTEPDGSLWPLESEPAAGLQDYPRATELDTTVPDPFVDSDPQDPLDPAPVQSEWPDPSGRPATESSPTESGWHQPLEPAPHNEQVHTSGHPANLEDAIPSGRAFESGMASLLAVGEPGTAPPVEPLADDLPPQAPPPTSSGLTRRQRGQSKVPIGEGRPVAASRRDPEEIRSMLSRYRDGIKGNRFSTETREEGS